MIFSEYWLIFFIPGLLLGLYAQYKLSSAYRRYSRVGTQAGVSGAQAARMVLDQAGLQDIPIHQVRGQLTDHYDPTKRALFLSAHNFQSDSIAAVGVAAHEAGHALQHAQAYAPLQMRMALVPVTQFASYAWMGILGLGFFLGGAFFSKFIYAAIAIFAVLTLFQVITLPVEFDASRRAKIQLQNLGIVTSAEAPHVSKVLSAAAMTYVAAMVASVSQLLHLLLLAGGRD